MTIHIVMGPPCAGKTTWIAEQRSDDEPVVDFDALAHALGSSEHHDPPEAIGQAAFAARVAAVARIFDGVEADAWVIQSTATAEKIDAWHDQGCEFHLLDPGLDECLRRAEDDDRPEVTADRIRAWYDDPPDVPDDTEIITDPPDEKGAPVTQFKTKAFNVKAASEEDAVAGIFEGYAAVFGNKDSYGDIILPGAFADSLATYGKDGAGVPCYWSHQVSDPMKNIGVTLSAIEDDHGLRVRVQLDLDNPNGAYVHKLLAEGRATQMSFMYTIVEGAWVDKAADEGGSYYELRKLNLWEVSVVALGANQETEIISVKTALGLVEDTTDGHKPPEGAKGARGSGEAGDAGEEPKSANAEEPGTANAEEPEEVKQGSVESARAIITALEFGA